MRYPLCALIALALAACGSDTGRARVSFQAEIAGKGDTTALPNDHGWTVELSEAKLYLGGLYFFEGAPLFAERRPSERAWALARGLWISEAWAHPGHYVEGEALADVLCTKVVDLLGPTTALGPGYGVTGSYRSARVVLGTSPELSNHTATLRGVARQGERSLEFSGTVDLAAPVEGVAFGAEVEATTGTVHADVELVEWVRRIDFDLLSAGPVELAPGSQAHNALTRGVDNTTAYHFTWTE